MNDTLSDDAKKVWKQLCARLSAELAKANPQTPRDVRLVSLRTAETIANEIGRPEQKDSIYELYRTVIDDWQGVKR